MRFAASSKIAACIVGIGCSLGPTTSGAQSCKCPRNPGPGGGVQCARDQVATCDPSSGECNCTCDTVRAGKTKADYEAQIFSKVLHTKVDPAELSSPQYSRFVSSFRKSTEDKGTFSFDKEAGAGTGRQVKVGVPEWLEEVLGGKGGPPIGPGASVQIPPGTTIEATTNAPDSAAVGINSGTVVVNPPVNPNKAVVTYGFDGMKRTTSPDEILADNSAVDVFAEFKKRSDAHDWSGLATLAEEQKKLRPEWLTPYFAGAEAYSQLCEKDKALENLRYFLDKADGSPEYADAIAQAKHNLQTLQAGHWPSQCH